MYPDSDCLDPKSRDGEGLRKLTPSADRPLSAQFAQSARSLETEMLAVLPDVRALAGWQDGQGSPSVEITEPRTTYASSYPWHPL